VVSLARRVAVNTSALALGRVAYALSGVAGTIVATRYLGPEAFSSLTLSLLLVSIFATVGDGGVYQVVAREIARRPEDEDRLLANTLGLGLVIAVAAAALALAASQLLYGDAGGLRVREGTAILLIQILVTALAGTANAHLTAHQRLLPVAVTAGVAALAFVVVLAAAVALDWGFAGVAAAYATGGLLTALPIVALWRARGVRVAASAEVWRDLIRWGAPQGAIVVVGALYFRLDSFLLSFLATDREVAYYGVAYKVVEFLMFLPLYFLATLFPVFARAERHTAALAGQSQAAFTLLQLAAVPVVLVFAGFADEIVLVIGGPRFAAAGPALAILVVALAFVFLNTLFTQALIAQGEQLALLALLLAILAGNVALNFVLIPPLGVEGAALAVLGSEIAALAVGLRLFRRLAAPPRPFEPVRVALAGFAGLAVLLGVRALADAADLPALVVLAAGALLVAGTYAGMLAALRAVPGELTDLLAPLRRRIATR